MWITCCLKVVQLSFSPATDPVVVTPTPRHVGLAGGWSNVGANMEQYMQIQIAMIAELYQGKISTFLALLSFIYTVYLYKYIRG